MRAACTGSVTVITNPVLILAPTLVRIELLVEFVDVQEAGVGELELGVRVCAHAGSKMMRWGGSLIK